MPGLDGLGVLRALRDGVAEPVPVVVVSAFSPARGAHAVNALAEGAFDLVAKPTAAQGLDVFADGLGRKVADAAHAGRSRRPRVATAPRRVSHARTLTSAADAPVVVIACSTGGPRALAELLPALPSPLGAGVLIVQHMPPGFTASLASRLDAASALSVRESAGGEALRPDVALLAPGGSHLRLSENRRTQLSDAAPEGGLRPRADLTIADVARLYGPRVVLAVLTGMGRDGLHGARAVKAAGRVVAEAEETCTIYGMPRAVAEAGLADVVLPLRELAAAIAREVGA
jgi:two-component system chemotaxis response regulator CheB